MFIKRSKYTQKLELTVGGILTIVILGFSLLLGVTLSLKYSCVKQGNAETCEVYNFLVGETKEYPTANINTPLENNEHIIRKCIESHNSPYTTMMFSGTVWFPVTHSRVVCDKWSDVASE